VTRRLSRIRAIAALALAVAALAVPAAVAQTPDQRDAPARRPALPVASPGNAGWVDASIIVAMMLFAGTTMVGVRVQQRSLRA
jgi:hypothetical protein